MRKRVSGKGRMRRGAKAALAVPQQQRDVRCLMVGKKKVQIAVAVKIADADVAGQMPRGKRRASSGMKVSFAVPKQNSHRSGIRIGRDDIRLAVVIDVRDDDSFGIAAHGNHDSGEMREFGGRDLRAASHCCEQGEERNLDQAGAFALLVRGHWTLSTESYPRVTQGYGLKLETRIRGASDYFPRTAYS